MIEASQLPLIVGAQYYRAPTPARSEWARDLKAFADAGFNTVKIWAQWRWNNPAEGEYDFGDVLELLDLAAQNRLHVVINTIFDVAPAWLYRKYPDCAMVTHDGRTLGPQSLSYRQIGGAPGPCLHHPGARAAARSFLAACADALAGAPALLLWDAWNEPELTVGIARAPELENIVCYCDHSRRAFTGWLRRKYGDDVARLDAAWGFNYRSWDEIELPRSPGTYRDMLDWRRFFVDTITDELRGRVDLLHAHDPAHPVMAHSVPFPIFNLVTCGSDDFELANLCDLFGNSAGSNPQSADLLASAAAGKPVINSEVHALPGSTFQQFGALSDVDMDRYLLAPLAHDIKGFLFWQYRPELLGNESPNWGLTDRAGGPTPWLERAAAINARLQERHALILRAANRPPDVGILLDPENEIFHWCITHGIDYLSNAVKGAYDALYRANFRVAFLHPRRLPDVVGQIPVIYCPAPYWLQDETLEALRAYVAAGGVLVSEPYFAGMNAANGLHRVVAPGAGFDEIFGVTQGYVMDARSAIYDAYHDGGSHAAASESYLDATWKGRRHSVPCYHQVAQLQPTSAEVLGHFGNGWIGLTAHDYGEGRAYYLGSYLSGAAGKGLAGAGEFLAALCETPQSAQRPHSASGTVRVDVLSDSTGQLVVVQALAGAASLVILQLPGLRGRSLHDIMNGDMFQLELGSPYAIAHVTLSPRQVRVFDVV